MRLLGGDRRLDQLAQGAFQARVLVQESSYLHLGILDGQGPASRPAFRLVIPFQQVHEQSGQLADQRKAFALADAFNLLSEVLGIQLVQLSATQQGRLLQCPSLGVLIVVCRHLSAPED
jgi:hypothetical protein